MRSLLPRRWDDFWKHHEGLLGELFQLESFLKEPFRLLQGERYPAVDIEETDTEYRIKADVPGYSKDNLEIELRDNLLKISGKMEAEERIEQKGMLRQERRVGQFQRAFQLPDDIDVEGAEATFKNGVLEIKLPKTGGKRGHKLPIK